MTKELKEKIESAYRTIGSNSFYDEMMTHSSYLGSFVNYLVWGYSKADSDLINGRVLSYIGENFDGKLLDVPIGTGVLTIPFYSLINKADINCLDYSEEMLNQAKEKAEKLKINNIKFLQGDVGNLPFEDNTFDIVLSMNGFHAFPDKDKAFKEITRVLKKGGFFIGCFYIKGKAKITDLLVNTFLSKKGWFNPPFYTKEEVEQLLSSKFFNINLNNDGSIVYFSCIKS